MRLVFTQVNLSRYKMSENVNESIIKMVRNFKSSVEDDIEGFSLGNYKKRSFSSVSNDSQCSSEDSLKVKRVKQENMIHVSHLGSPREVRRLRTDLLEARNTILNLENRIQHMHSVRKEMEVMYENEVKLLKKQHENDRKSIEALEAQLITFRQREADLKKQLAEVIFILNFDINSVDN